MSVSGRFYFTLIRIDANKIVFLFFKLIQIISGPTAGLRAVRILHDLEIAGKKLVAKVDAKNKLLLDSYKIEEEERNKGKF